MLSAVLATAYGATLVTIRANRSHPVGANDPCVPGHGITLEPFADSEERVDLPARGLARQTATIASVDCKCAGLKQWGVRAGITPS